MRKHTKPYVFGGLASLGLLLIFGFQNCAELNPSVSAVAMQSSIENRLREDKLVLDRLLKSDVLKAWVSTKGSTVTADGGGVVSAVSSVDATTGVSLAPTASTTGPNLITSAVLSSKVLEFTGTKNLRSAVTDAKLTGTAYSIVAVVEAPLNGRLISLIGNDFGTEEVSISVASGKLKVSHLTTSANSSWATADLAVTSGALVIGASFGREPEKMLLQINGLPASITVQTAGAPQNSSDTLRSLVLGDPVTAATLKVSEVLVFNKELSASELNTIARYAAERSGYAGVGYDPSVAPTPAPGGGSTTDPNFTKVKPVLDAVCASCHFHSTWSSYTAAQYVTDGYVVKGDALNSKLYYRLIGSEGSQGPKSMPQVGTVSAQELSDIKTWINSMK